MNRKDFYKMIEFGLIGIYIDVFFNVFSVSYYNELTDKELYIALCKGEKIIGKKIVLTTPLKLFNFKNSQIEHCDIKLKNNSYIDLGKFNYNFKFNYNILQHE